MVKRLIYCRQNRIKEKTAYLLSLREFYKTKDRNGYHRYLSTCGIDFKHLQTEDRKKANFSESLEHVQHSKRQVVVHIDGHNISKKQLSTTFYVVDMKV